MLLITLKSTIDNKVTLLEVRIENINIPKVLRPDTTVTDFFLPRGALDTCTSLGTSSFFFDFNIPLPPRF